MTQTAPSVAFVTLGCAKNEVDSASMARDAAKAGYLVASDPEHADVIVVNTCSFIQAATEESLDAIFELAKLDGVARGRTRIVVAGCMPARYGNELADELAEADAFLPCSEEGNLVDLLSKLVGEGAATKAAGTADSTCEAPFAYVKISDGCDRWCSYCTIPRIRGRYRSFSFDDIERNVRDRISEGAREIVLIAQDTGRWGQDFEPSSSLAWLVSELAEKHPDAWFRVMYVQPEGITDEYLDAVAQHANVCSYFDIPLQHVDPSILKSMNRTGSYDEFVDLAHRIRSRVPDAALRTTLIAGYPGETEEQFDSLLSFVREGLFDYVGVFPYSREDGTRAADLPDQVPEETKLVRAQLVRDAADEASERIIANRIGTHADVLIEGVEDDGQLFGRTMQQAPEVDGGTYVDKGRVGDIAAVEIVDTMFYEMEGEVL